MLFILQHVSPYLAMLHLSSLHVLGTLAGAPPAAPGWFVAPSSGARRFPAPFPEQPGSRTVLRVADCSGDTHIGCVHLPTAAARVEPPPPSTALRPPDCSSGNVGCLQLPMPWGVPQMLQMATPATHMTHGVSELPGGLECTGCVTGVYTKALAIGDVSGDGNMDLVFGYGTWPGNPTPPLMPPTQLLIGDGAGGFGTVVDLSQEWDSATYAIELGDVNGDGMMDIIVGSDNRANQLYMNDGSCGFGTGFDPAGAVAACFVYQDLPGGIRNTRALALGDVNGDGALDLVIGNNAQTDNLLLGDGSGGFGTAAVDLPGGFRQTKAVVLGDVTGDGWLDIIVGSVDYWEANLLLVNSGSGTFDQTSDLPGLAFGFGVTYAMALADITGDGALDLVVGNQNDANQLLVNDGTGAFVTSVDLPGESRQTHAIAIADITGDGALDLVVANQNGFNQLVVGDGTGSFDEAMDLAGGKQTTDAIVIGDLTGDGVLDIVVGNENGGTANQLLVTDASGSFHDTTFELPGGALFTRTVVLGDVSGDGVPDMVIGNYGQPNQLLLGSDSFDAFGMAADLPGGTRATSSIAIGDVSGDGLLDLVIGNYGFDAHQVLLNDGSGGFGTAADLPGPSDQTTMALALGDMDGDGVLDIVVANTLQANLLLIGDGSGGFSTPIDLPGEASLETMTVVLGDVSGDSVLDIIFGHAQVANQLFIGDGSGGFGTAIELPDTTHYTWYTQALALGDVNGDGFLDLVDGNFNENKLLLGDGAGNFGTPILLPGAGTTTSIALGDVTRDGFIDILVGRQNMANQLLINDRSGGFGTAAVDLPGGTLETFAVALGDVDGDGDLDVLVANSNTANQLIARVQCPSSGTARSSLGANCFLCPTPSTRRIAPHVDVCVECGLNEEVDFSNACAVCRPGTQRPLGGVGCTDCAPGARWTTPGSSCRSCEPGTYSPFNASIKCFPCSQGEFAGEYGMSECEACAAGATKASLRK